MLPYENENPLISEPLPKRNIPSVDELNINVTDPIDSQEIFEILCNIKDPEHSETTLEQLSVIKPELINIDENKRIIYVYFTPTIPNCSMSSLIGLCIIAMLSRCFPFYKNIVKIEPGKHMDEKEINRQLCDKERVLAAFEGENLMKTINSCLSIDWDFRYPNNWIDKYIIELH